MSGIGREAKPTWGTKRWIRHAESIEKAVLRRSTRSLAAMLPIAGTFVAGCSAPAGNADWGAHFEVVDTLTVADSVLSQLLSQRDSAPERPWRVAGLGTEAWMPSPAAGRRAADAFMGIPRDVGEVPYWPSWMRIYGATMGSTVFAATNFTYAIRVYGGDGIGVDSISEAPPSWRQARRPEMGEFAYSTAPENRAYFRSFTFLTGLAAVSDGVLIVTHGRYLDVPDSPTGRLDQIVGAYPGRLLGLTAMSEYVNVYVDGSRLVTDAPAPGEILGYSPGRVVFARRMPGQAGYTLTEYAWKRR